VKTYLAYDVGLFFVGESRDYVTMNLGFEDNVPDEDRYTDFTTNETSAESYSSHAAYLYAEVANLKP
jgi:hypothetical protein